MPLARKLVPLLRTGMLLLADRAYDAADLMKEVSAAGADFLIRGSATRKPPVVEVLPDGSRPLSRVDGLRVRIIEAGPGRARCATGTPARGQATGLIHHAAGLAPLPGRGWTPDRSADPWIRIPAHCLDALIDPRI